MARRAAWVVIFIVTIALGGGIAMGFELKSSAFAAAAMIPKKHTCDGEDLSPALEWTGIPEGTNSLALICDDPDAPVGTWVHWVLYGLPVDVNKLPEGVPPDKTIEKGVCQGVNDFRRIGYGGPCPPPGKPHRYFFKLYALKEKVNLSPGASKKDLLKAMEGRILGQAELMGKYGR